MDLYKTADLNFKGGGVFGKSLVLLSASLVKSGVGGPVGTRLMSAPPVTHRSALKQPLCGETEDLLCSIFNMVPIMPQRPSLL